MLRPMLLIRNAELDGAPADVRIRDGRIAEVGRLEPAAGETSVDAGGGAMLPGLHDHHIHFLALAAARLSVPCGPPEVTGREQLEAALAAAPATRGGWIRGVGYHESVAGDLDRAALDALAPSRPLRIQHASGKMWFLNASALERVGLDPGGDGRLFRRDEWLRERIPAAHDLEAAARATSAMLAGYGVTGFTDATPGNDPDAVRRLRQLAARQRVTAMGSESLPDGHLKVMLDDAALPDYDALCARIARAHARGRPVAFHCVTRTELVFALAALRDAGCTMADRIEHASVADTGGLRLLAETGVTVVTQPNFIAERGDRYRADVEPAEHDQLYRCAGFLDAGIPLGGGTDAPFGGADPWAAMRAAVARRTASGAQLGAGETVSPERALALFTTPADDPGGRPRRIEPGAAADLCLLARPWREARRRLVAGDVAATWLAGRRTHP